MNESLLSGFINIILEGIPAVRSLVLWPDAEGRPKARLSRGIEWAAEQEPCRTVVGRVFESGQPVLVRDFGSDPAFQGCRGIRENRIRSALCLPLFSKNGGAGAFYLDRTDETAGFTASDLELLSAAAGFLNHLLTSGTPGSEAVRTGRGENGSPHLVGQEISFRRVRDMVSRVRNTSAPVFISGESGTGKELVARTIHETGSRSRGQFVAVNCGAIPDHLLESELFGYARGAFTGAARDRAGLIEEADHGTFFLDEIGDLSPHLQSKLLRVLEERRIRRLGENRTRPVDVRFVSATHKDLDREVRECRFREDLYYRLKIIVIELPPLRERKADLLPLINHFAESYAREMKIPRPYFAPLAMEMLLQYSWPGNVRELQNEIQRCLVMAGGNNLIREEYLSPEINPRGERYSEASRDLRRARMEFEHRFLRDALARCGQHRARTAAEIGITRQGLFKLIKKYGIGAAWKSDVVPSG
ncbi:MAG: sigma 54-interacting transcriptional regulator [Candidatus Aminicenantales bacterium]